MRRAIICDNYVYNVLIFYLSLNISKTLLYFSGLPHVHILLIMHPDDVPKTPEEIDRIISAEIPHPDECPELHELVKKKMMHGPCEGYNLQSPCLFNPKKRCEKEFPKHCQEFTTMTEDGVTTYRRRTPEQGGRTVEKQIKGKTVQLSNKWVVPIDQNLRFPSGMVTAFTNFFSACGPLVKVGWINLLSNILLILKVILLYPVN